MGNYVACKKYKKKKRQSGFINFTSTHLELTAKSYVAIGTGTLKTKNSSNKMLPPVSI